jgi:hypothetical protein
MSLPSIPDSTRKAVRDRSQIVQRTLTGASQLTPLAATRRGANVTATPLPRGAAQAAPQAQAASLAALQQRVADLERVNGELNKFQAEAKSLYALATAHEAERSELRRAVEQQTLATERATRALSAAEIRTAQRTADLSERLATAEARVAELSVSRQVVLADLEREMAARVADSQRTAADRSLVDAKAALADATRTAQATAARLEQERDTALAHLRTVEQSASAKLDAAERRAAAHRERAEQLAKELAQARQAPPPPSLVPIDASAEANDAAMRTMANEMTRLRSELADARRAHRALATTARNAENGLILQQRIDELQQRVDQRDGALAEQAAMLAAAEQANAARAADARLLANEGGVSGALARLASLRRDNEVLLARCLALETAARRSDALRAEAESLLSDAVSRLESAEETSRGAALLVERAQRTAAIARSERDGLQRLVESYKDSAAVDAAQIVLDLQHRLAESEAQADELENALLCAAEQTAHSSESRKRLRSHESAADDNDADAAGSIVSRPSLSALPCAACLRRAEEAPALAAAGAYDHAELQVIHMSMNPLAAARRRLAAAQVECPPSPLVPASDALRTPARPAGSAALQTPFGAAMTPSADADKRIARLKEVFKEKISEFREAVHVLFGYRIDMSDQRCRLLSQYSSSAKDALLFDLRRNERGVLVVELLENAYSRSLGPELTNYLYKLHSMPAFLSNHTIELFSSQTFAQT